MPTIRVDDDVWRYLQSKARPFEDSPNDVLRRELGLASARPPQRLPISLSRNPDDQRVSLVWPQTDYTHHIVSGYKLNGQSLPARSFREVLMGTAKTLRAQHLASFDIVALHVWGKKRPYFSKNPNDLRSPWQIPNSDIFAETNLNANIIVAICMTLVKEFGHNASGFAIL